MKKLTILTVSLLLLIGCSSEKKQKGIPTFNVNESYPKKEIILQDIANVEYIPLETRDDVLMGQYYNTVPAGKDKILAYSMRAGNIFIFNSNGKFISKFNHKGQSGEEYYYIANVFADIEKNEVFVVNAAFPKFNIQVYTMQGKYKRTLNFENVTGKLIPLGNNKILCYKNPNTENPFAKKSDKDFKTPHLIVIDKNTGQTNTIINLPAAKGVTPLCFFKINGRTAFRAHPPKLFVETNEGIITNDVACDTTFALNNAEQLTPILIRTPKVSPEDKPQKMLGIDALSKDAIYLGVTLNQFNPKTRKGFDKTAYQLQRADNKIFEYTLKNADAPSNKDLAVLKQYTLIQTVDLKEALEEGKLKGKLKTIAEKLKEDDNPVLMKVTLK